MSSFHKQSTNVGGCGGNGNGVFFFCYLTAVTLVCSTFSFADACSSSSVHDEYKVIRKTDSDGKQLVVAVGDDARLSCQTNFSWKKCLWKPPRNGVRQVGLQHPFVSDRVQG